MRPLRRKIRETSAGMVRGTILIGILIPGVVLTLGGYLMLASANRRLGEWVGKGEPCIST